MRVSSRPEAAELNLKLSFRGLHFPRPRRARSSRPVGRKELLMAGAHPSCNLAPGCPAARLKFSPADQPQNPTQPLHIAREYLGRNRRASCSISEAGRFCGMSWPTTTTCACIKLLGLPGSRLSSLPRHRAPPPRAALPQAFRGSRALGGRHRQAVGVGPTVSF